MNHGADITLHAVDGPAPVTQGRTMQQSEMVDRSDNDDDDNEDRDSGCRCCMLSAMLL